MKKGLIFATAVAGLLSLMGCDAEAEQLKTHRFIISGCDKTEDFILRAGDYDYRVKLCNHEISTSLFENGKKGSLNTRRGKIIFSLTGNKDTSIIWVNEEGKMTFPRIKDE